MEVAKIRVHENCAVVIQRKTVTSGMVGATVSFEFDESWEGLTRTAVYKCGGIIHTKPLSGDVGTIPAEVIARSGWPLEIGVCGTNADKVEVIPTVYAEVGKVRPGADPSGDESTDPSLPVWAQLQNRIDRLVKQEDGKYLEIDPTLTVEGSAADAKAVGDAISKLSGGNVAYIVEKASGAVISVSDASDMELAGLRIFGKTTQDGTPTPEAPVELVSVGDGGQINAKICGRNILHYPYIHTSKTEKGITFIDNGDGSITISGTATADAWFHLMVFDLGDLWWSSKYVLAPYIFSGVPKDIRLEYDPQQKLILITVPSGVSIDTTIYPQIEIGTAATEWDSPKGKQVLTFSTPNGLPGIPVTSGGNYTDENGQQWICDEVDFSRGVYVQRVKKKRITSALNWAYSSGTQRFYAPDADFNASPGDTYAGVAALCTHFNPHTGGSIADMGMTYINNSSQGFAYRYDALSGDINAWKAFLDANEVYIVAELHIPTETALSAEQLAAFAALHSNYPNTTILNDGGAGMEVKYVADTKLYVDKKFAELSAALLNQ